EGIHGAAPRPLRDAMLFSRRRANTAISFAACLSPFFSATSIPLRYDARASSSRPLSASAFPSSFQAAEYPGSFSTAAPSCAAAAWGSPLFRYSEPREKRSSAPSLGVPTSFRRFVICCEVIGVASRAGAVQPSADIITAHPAAPCAHDDSIDRIHTE